MDAETMSHEITRIQADCPRCKALEERCEKLEAAANLWLEVRRLKNSVLCDREWASSIFTLWDRYGAHNWPDIEAVVAEKFRAALAERREGEFDA